MSETTSNPADPLDEGVMQDLVDWVKVMVGDAFDKAVENGVIESKAVSDPMARSWLVDEVGGSFEDMLVNHYGED